MNQLLTIIVHYFSLLVNVGLASFCYQWFKPWFKLSWQKQVSATCLPKHNKCSNILDKSTHFFAEHNTIGTPFVKYSARINLTKMAFTRLCLDCYVQLCQHSQSYLGLTDAVFICVDAHFKQQLV